jgi:hypothetical protein
VSSPQATRGVEPISYRGALVSTLLRATVYTNTQFAECTGAGCISGGITEEAKAVADALSSA